MPRTLPMPRFTTLLAAVLLFHWCAAQDLVSTTPGNRTALLEQFTAMGCGNCPAAHAIANTLVTVYPDDLVVIGVHGGSLAYPTGSQPDFRTADGSALWSELSVLYQPQGTVNRGGLSAASQWATAVANILEQQSPVNLGAATTFNSGTRELTVDLELYYTADRTAEDRISIVLLQDHIIGYQQDYSNGAQPAYDHRHVLRDHITPLAGDPVALAQQSDLVQRTYTFTVPDEWEISDLSVVAFVREEGGVVWQAHIVPASGGVTAVPHIRTAQVGQAFPVPADEVLFIPLMEVAEARTVQLRDAQGRLVKEQRVPMASALVGVDVSDLAPGVYTYGYAGGAARRAVVR